MPEVDEELARKIELQNKILKDQAGSMIGEKRIRSIVAARPLTRDEVGEVVEKYNSIARDMNRNLKEGMAAQGFKVGFDEYGAFIIGQKGKAIRVEDYVKVTRKRKPWD